MPVDVVSITRATADDPRFLKLAAELTEMLAELNGEAQAFYGPLNDVEDGAHAVLALAEGEPVACGAFRLMGTETVEIKRMFVSPEWRGKGISKRVLSELEAWSTEVGRRSAILETSRRLEAANRLYKRSGYEVIPNYGPYVDAPDSVCMRKDL